MTVAWWPSIMQDVTKYISGCLNCAKNNPDAKVIKSLMHHQLIGEPWMYFQMDLIGPLPNTGRGHKYCLIIVDCLCKAFT